jgi:hypothetical protein
MAGSAALVPDEIAQLSLGRDDDPEAPPPSPPNIHTKGIVAVDILDKFTAAAKTLSPGELVKDGYFTLFEAVSALEVRHLLTSNLIPCLEDPCPLTLW